jgi:hypothetical protein
MADDLVPDDPVYAPGERITQVVVTADGKVNDLALYGDGNPIPDGATQTWLVRTANGGNVLETDYLELRRAEYPPVGDLVDAFAKGMLYLRAHGTDLGPDLGAVLDLVVAATTKYPAPA